MIKTIRNDLACYLTKQIINISILIKQNNHYMNENYRKQINSPQFSFRIGTLKHESPFLEIISFNLDKICQIPENISNRLNFCQSLYIMFTGQKISIHVQKNKHKFYWQNFNQINLFTSNNRDKIYNIIFLFINNFCMYWNTKKNITRIKNDLDSYILTELI